MAGSQPEMSIEQKLAAVHAMRNFSSRAMHYMGELARTNKPVEDSAKEIVAIFPDWGRWAKQIQLIVQYLRLYGEE